MGRTSKRFREIAKGFNTEKSYSVAEAIAILKKCPPVKFDQSVDVSLKANVDPRKSDQQLRGTVALPNGTGKTMRIVVFAKGEKIDEALAAGADFAGHQELVDKVAGGWTDFDAVIATPEMMREVGKLGKVLGPRGLMPTPKAGTVTNDVATAVTEVKGGKIEFKVDKGGVINAGVAKISFDEDKIKENIQHFVHAVLKARPTGAKGHLIKSIALSSTMGPGLKIDLRDVEAV